MYGDQKNFRLTRTQEKQLREKLQKTLLTIVSIVAGLAFIIIFFAPKLGVFFGFFSKHRNEKDTTSQVKPSTPIFSRVPEAIKDEKITLNGYSTSGYSVVLYVNGPESSRTTVGSDGLFTFPDIALIKGPNTLFAKAVDSTGLESDASITFTVKVDNDKPKITLDFPKNGSTVENLDKRVEIKGKIDEKATIKINGRLAIQRPDLSFEFLLGVEEGNLEIKIEATDLAGNQSLEKINITYQKP